MLTIVVVTSEGISYIIILEYVDDTLVVDSSMDDIRRLKQQFSFKEFDIKDLARI